MVEFKPAESMLLWCEACRCRVPNDSGSPERHRDQGHIVNSYSLVPSDPPLAIEAVIAEMRERAVKMRRYRSDEPEMVARAETEASSLEQWIAKLTASLRPHPSPPPDDRQIEAIRERWKDARHSRAAKDINWLLAALDRLRWVVEGVWRPMEAAPRLSLHLTVGNFYRVTMHGPNEVAEPLDDGSPRYGLIEISRADDKAEALRLAREWFDGMKDDTPTKPVSAPPPDAPPQGIAALRQALVDVRAMVIGEHGASAWENINGERADAVLAASPRPSPAGTREEKGTEWPPFTTEREQQIEGWNKR